MGNYVFPTGDDAAHLVAVYIGESPWWLCWLKSLIEVVVENYDIIL